MSSRGDAFIKWSEKESETKVAQLTESRDWWEARCQRLIVELDDSLKERQDLKAATEKIQVFEEQSQKFYKSWLNAEYALARKAEELEACQTTSKKIHENWADAEKAYANENEKWESRKLNLDAASREIWALQKRVTYYEALLAYQTNNTPSQKISDLETRIKQIKDLQPSLKAANQKLEEELAQRTEERNRLDEERGKEKKSRDYWNNLACERLQKISKAEKERDFWKSQVDACRPEMERTREIEDSRNWWEERCHEHLDSLAKIDQEVRALKKERDFYKSKVERMANFLETAQAVIKPLGEHLFYVYDPIFKQWYTDLLSFEKWTGDKEKATTLPWSEANTIRRETAQSPPIQLVPVDL